MEVTKSNFELLYPEIITDINNASFISVDLELTGLSNGQRGNAVSAMDSPAMYYTKQRRGAVDCICIQFGLAVFLQDPQSLEYSCKPYNFYIFPRQVASFLPSPTFIVESSAVQFLCNYKFNFNKVFQEGITYMNMDRQAELSQILEERREKAASRFAQMDKSVPIKIPPQHQKTVDDACAKLSSVLSEDCTENEVQVEGCNGFIRKLIFQSIRERHGRDELCVETKDGVLISRKPRSKAEEEEEMRKRELSDIKFLEEATGFSRVVKALSESRKLIVGHNMFLDLCQICHHFLCPLPEYYSEFREMLSSIFPSIIDTKFFSSIPKFQCLIPSTTLSHLYQRLSEPPFIRPKIVLPEEVLYDDSTDKFHDAGFDAFVTGHSFISLFNYLAAPKNTSSNAALLVDGQFSIVLNRVLNRIFFMKLNDFYMDLNTSDPKPDRRHVFSLSFPKNWTQDNIAKLFSPYGPVQIWWVSDSKAWVSLVKKEEASRATSALCSRSMKDVSIMTYESAVKEYEQPSSKRQDSSPIAQNKRHKPNSSFSQASRTSESRIQSTSSRTTEVEEQENSLSQLAGECVSEFGTADDDW